METLNNKVSFVNMVNVLTNMNEQYIYHTLY